MPSNCMACVFLFNVSRLRKKQRQGIASDILLRGCSRQATQERQDLPCKLIGITTDVQQAFGRHAHVHIKSGTSIKKP